MTTKNFKVRKGLEIGDSISITDAGVISGLTTDNLSAGTTNEYYTNAKVDARITSGAITGALGYTPENSANKGQALGYASLDGSGLVPSSQLPSYVDDVLEYANLAAMPGTGTGGKIYVAQDTGKIYRWSGSAYVEISPSPGSTDSVTEGSTNLYYTDARARGAVSASGSLSYNSSTGVFSYTTPTTDGITEGSTNLYFTNTRARGAVSASGSLSYDSGTGVFSYTTPTTDGITEGTTNLYYTDARSRNSISAGGDLSYNSTTGVISYTLPSISYNDLTDKPTLFSGSYTDLTNKPSLFSGSYTDLTNKPSIPSTTSDISEGTNLYYTDARSRSAISGGTGITYNSSTGVIAIGQDVATTANVTFGSVSTATLKSNNATTALTLTDTTGDVTYASRLLSSASKTIRNGSNRATSYASVSGATSEDTLMVGIGASGVPISGLLVTNADLPTGSTSGRRPYVLVRSYGGNEYNGVASTTPPQNYFAAESSRGTTAEPRALSNNNPIGSFVGYGNAGSDLTSGNTPYWTAQQYPTQPNFGLRTFQAWKGPYGTAAGAAFFVATIAASSTSLVVSNVTSGTILIGQEIRLNSNANWSTTSNAYQIIAQVSGTTGGAGTYTLNANPGTYTSATAMYSCNTTLGAGLFMNLIPNDTPITTASRVSSTITPDQVVLRAQATNSTTNAYEFRSWATTNYGGTNTTFRQGSDKVYLGLSDSRAAFATPVAFPTYTKAQAAAITGSAGWQICISDSASGSNPNGMMAFWDTTNSRWSYIHDNSAV